MKEQLKHIYETRGAAWLANEFQRIFNNKELLEKEYSELLNLKERVKEDPSYDFKGWYVLNFSFNIIKRGALWGVHMDATGDSDVIFLSDDEMSDIENGVGPAFYYSIRGRQIPADSVTRFVFNRRLVAGDLYDEDGSNLDQYKPVPNLI